jgi:putative transposase
MARRARLSLPGIPWHIIQRGQHRSACFLGPDDHRFCLETLAALSRRHECLLHAYCLMPNHMHLLVTPACATGVAMLMKTLSQRYAQYANRKRGTSGTFWEGRYRSCLIQPGEHVLACYRYIELNPVRATLVDEPEGYVASSFRGNALAEPSGMLTPRLEYLALGVDARTRAARYRALVQQPLDALLVERIRRATNGNYVVGDWQFERELALKLERRVTRGKAGRPPRQAQSLRRGPLWSI